MASCWATILSAKLMWWWTDTGWLGIWVTNCVIVVVVVVHVATVALFCLNLNLKNCWLFHFCKHIVKCTFSYSPFENHVINNCLSETRIRNKIICKIGLWSKGSGLNRFFYMFLPLCNAAEIIFCNNQATETRIIIIKVLIPLIKIFLYLQEIKRCAQNWD